MRATIAFILFDAFSVGNRDELFPSDSRWAILFVIFDDKRGFMISVSRPINGITLNGDEFLLDETGEVMFFADKTAAINWLHEQGVTDAEIEGFNFNSDDEDDEDDFADRIYVVG